MMEFDKGSSSSLPDYPPHKQNPGKKKRLGGNQGKNPTTGNITDVMSKKNKASIS